MAEFTDRERKIIHGVSILMNPAFQGVPPVVRQNVYMMCLKMQEIEFTEEELKDLMFGIEDEQKLVFQNAMGMMSKMGNAFKGIEKVDLKSLFR